MEPPRPPRTSERKERTPFASIFAFENFLLVMGLLFGLQLVDRSFGPVLPLHLGELGYAQVEVPVVAGILFSVLAFTTALDNQLSSRLLKRHSPRVMIAWAVITAAAALAVFVLSAALGLLVARLAVIGLCMGTAITTAYTAGGAVLAREVHATGFGFLTSASLTGVAISPVLSGLLAAWSIRAVFVTAAVVLGMLAVVVRRVMVERNPPVESAPAVEES